MSLTNDKDVKDAWREVEALWADVEAEFLTEEENKMLLRALQTSDLVDLTNEVASGTTAFASTMMGLCSSNVAS